MSVENVLKFSCDRCGNSKLTNPDESGDNLPENWMPLTVHAFLIKHLCPGCKKDFDLFMANKQANPNEFGFPEVKENANG